MNKSIERLENLIRVVSSTPDDKFDLKCWFDRNSGCGCAIGHAMRDTYFFKEGLGIAMLGQYSMRELGCFFDIPESRASQLFTLHVEPRYETRQDVLTALRVLLLEKMAQEMDLDNMPEYVVSIPQDSSLEAEYVGVDL
jgi:hypothetical protein